MRIFLVILFNDLRSIELNRIFKRVRLKCVNLFTKFGIGAFPCIRKYLEASCKAFLNCFYATNVEFVVDIVEYTEMVNDRNNMYIVQVIDSQILSENI